MNHLAEWRHRRLLGQLPNRVLPEQALLGIFFCIFVYFFFFWFFGRFRFLIRILLGFSLSRQSTVESDSGSNISIAGEPIRKSPREMIIPIAIEGGGFVTPRAETLSRKRFDIFIYSSKPNSGNQSIKLIFSLFLVHCMTTKMRIGMVTDTLH